MDTDWCLTCDCHFQGDGPYCSLDCAGPSVSLHSPSFSTLHHFDDHLPTHTSQWSGNGPAGIIAWASEIPPSASVSSGASTPRSMRSSSLSISSSKVSSPTTSTTFLPPKLLRSNHFPVPPTLCMSTPRPLPSSPSHPISTPHHHTTAQSMSRFSDANSMGQNSVLSAATESSLATPVSAQPVPFTPSKDLRVRLGAIATQVRSWVSPTPPLVSPLPKQRVSPAPANKPSDPQKHTVVVAHNHRSRPSAMNIEFSSPSCSDDTVPVWHLSSTILIDTPSKNAPRMMRDVRSNQRPYKSRGRKASRAAA